MAFTLTQVRTGEQKNFSVREILELLGDPINNEIIIHGESYRINNVQGDLGGGGGSTDSGTWRADWQKVPLDNWSKWPKSVFGKPKYFRS